MPKSKRVSVEDLRVGDIVLEGGFQIGKGFENKVIWVEHNGKNVSITWPGNNITTYHPDRKVTIQRRKRKFWTSWL